MLKTIVEKELSYSEIFSFSWEIYLKQFHPILFISLLIYLPLNTLLFFVSKISNTQITAIIDVIVKGLFGMIATLGVMVIVEKAILDENNSIINWKNALNRSFNRWGICIGTNILSGIIIIGLMFLLVVPGIIWSLYYSFVDQTVALRNLGGKSALNYSKTLVKGQWSKIFSLLFIIYFLNLLTIFAVGFISGPLPEILKIFSSTACDIASIFFTISATIVFLNIERLKNIPIPKVTQAVLENS